MSLFAELRRRHVFRVGLAYVVTAWALAEVADYAADNFGAPDWTVQMFTVLLILGFPLALILAWAFEVTPQGIKRAPGARAGRDPAGKETAGKSIAVLPFANLSADTENEYFADGLSEELLNVLAHIEKLRVPGRTSCFAFKGQSQDLRTIGEKLDVDHILEGSVRKSGDQLRITAQLVSVADGYHLWSETFDRKLDDIFVIQDEIAQAVTDILRVKLLGAAEREVRRTEDAGAYATYLEGRFHQRRMKYDEFLKALELYEKVLQESPDYVPALAASAETWAHVVASGDVSYEEGWPKAQAFINRALEIDPDYAEAQMVKGFFRSWWERDFDGGERHLRRAIELNPNFADAHRRLGAHLRLRENYAEALPCLEKAVQLDPLSSINLRQLAYTHGCMANFPKGEELLRKALDMDSAAGGLHYNLGELYLRQGKLELARAEYALEPIGWARKFGEVLVTIRESGAEQTRRLVDEFQSEYEDTGGYQMAIIHCALGDTEEALDWLEEAERQRDPGLMQMRMDPLLKPLRDDPRFRGLIEILDLAD